MLESNRIMLGESAIDALQQPMWQLRTKFSASSNAAKSLLFTGLSGGEGASTLALALATGVATFDLVRVLLIDADFFSRSLTLSENLGDAEGLRDWQPGQPLPVRPLRLASGVDLLPSGRSVQTSMAKLVASGQIEALMREASEAYELVVWDAPPLMTKPETRMLVPCVDGVVLVVLSGQSLLDELIKAADEITAVNGRLAGVVRNRA